MATKNKNIYFIAKDKNGIDLLCPFNGVNDRDAVTDKEFDECVEKDVIERYSGNIHIESS